MSEMSSSSTTPPTPFSRLPPELRQQVFLRADGVALLRRARAVCKEWNREIYNEAFWIKFIRFHRLVPDPVIPLLSDCPLSSEHSGIPALLGFAVGRNPFVHNLLEECRGDISSIWTVTSGWESWHILRGPRRLDRPRGFRPAPPHSGSARRRPLRKWFVTSSDCCYKEQEVHLDGAFHGLFCQIARLPGHELVLRAWERVTPVDWANELGPDDKEKEEEEEFSVPSSSCGNLLHSERRWLQHGVVYEMEASTAAGDQRQRKFKIRLNGRDLVRRGEESGSAAVVERRVAIKCHDDDDKGTVLYFGHGGMDVAMQGTSIVAELRVREEDGGEEEEAETEYDSSDSPVSLTPVRLVVVRPGLSCFSSL